MNKFKVCSEELSFTAFFAVVLCASLFCVGCGDGNVAGTSEEPNEIIAEGLSARCNRNRNINSNV